MTVDKAVSERSGLEVAIIGIALKFPGASTVDEFWENLKNGVESIHFFSEEELDNAGVKAEKYNQPNYVKARGMIKDIEYFDSYFFGYTPREAELMDPQMRLFYECVWSALEDAAYNPDNFAGRISIYAGGAKSLFWEGKSLLVDGGAGSFSAVHLSNIDFLSTRIAYKLNLRGPAITLQTACSTGLVAVDIACRDLLTGQCDMATAGAVSVPCQKREGYFYEEQMIVSPDGHCRAFDVEARGTIFCEGLGVVVLKRLDDAIRDADSIYAVILGSAVNNDGISKNSFTAPNIDGQVEVICAALHTAGISPESIGYVEAHGTGTILGDPIEVEALRLAFNSKKKGTCALGSVKTNIGHLDTAAGIAGLIKTVLSLKHGLIPPSLHYKNPNPAIDFKNSPFYVNTTLKKWETGVGREGSQGAEGVRRAGVSSFGVGGTNAHVILEEAPGIAKGEYPPPAQSLRDRHLLLLSARTAGALDRAAVNLANHLRKSPDADLADVSFTLQVGRKPFSHRLMVTASTVDEAVRLLDNPAIEKQVARDENRVIFMFSGQGSQYVNMGLDLYNNEPIFRREMNGCFEILKKRLDYDIKEILYPRDGSELKEINRTEVAQPLLFIIEYALAKLLMHWGITPFAMIGHSIGEYVAACLAGVFSLADALSVVVLRGKLMQQMPGGTMLSVPLGEKELFDLEGLDLAAVNSTNLCVVSGPEKNIENFERQMEEKGYHCQKLHTSHAFHSRMMEPVLKVFEENMGRIVLNRPGVPYISNITGTWITVEQATSPAYWSRHLRETVRFEPGLSELLKLKNGIFVEVGPGKALEAFVNRHEECNEEHKIINLMRHALLHERDDHYLQEKIGRLWLCGQPIDWKTQYTHERRLRVHLPTYSFDRHPYPVESELLKAITGGDMRGIPGSAAGVPVLTKRSDMKQWFYTSSWRRSVLAESEEESAGKTRNGGKDESHEQPWVVFTNNECSLSKQLVTYLKDHGEDIIEVRIGDKFAGYEEGSDKIYLLKPSSGSDYETLLDNLVQKGYKANRIIHLWNAGEDETYKEVELFEKCVEKGFYSLLYLSQALAKHHMSEGVRITVISSNMQEVTGQEKLYPLKATLLGPVMIMPLEFPGLVCRSIDIEMPPAGSESEKYLAQQILSECLATAKESQAAFRGNHRLVRAYDTTPLVQKEGIPRILRSNGVYLITGGMGGIGLVIAEYLFKQCGARLILTSRTSFPPREEWKHYIQTTARDVSTNVSRIKTLLNLESSGAEMLVYEADVSDYEKMKTVVMEAEKKWGVINGVIHCAGVPGGGLMQLKTREMAEKVLNPKVQGTLVLERIFRERRLDFMVLCSSINSVLPVLGQVDYCAANAFLDAFAYSQNALPGRTQTISINWDTWQEVGMAVDTAERQRGVRRVLHPLWERCFSGLNGDEVYLTHLNFNRHWVLNEHMTPDKKGVLPGTVYLEMVRAAFISGHGGHGGERQVELRDVRFISPLIVGEGEEREVGLVLKNVEESRDSFQFSFFSRAVAVTGKDNGVKQPVQVHAMGIIAGGAESNPMRYDLQAIESSCSQGETVMVRQENEKMVGAGGALVFGPRWRNMQRIKYGAHCGLALMKLDETYSDDLKHFKLHPALLDIGTSFLYPYINYKSPYIPFTYKRMTIKGDLVGTLYSYSRLVTDGTNRKDILKFNVTLLNDEGIELVDIEEFVMLEINEGMIGRLMQSASAAFESEDAGSSGTGQVGGSRSIFDTVDTGNILLQHGILSGEGVDAFARILRSKLSQVVISTLDLDERLSRAKVTAKEIQKSEGERQTTDSATHARPEIKAVYLAPRTDAERMLAEIWQNILGISRIGIEDNFFELGGDSLKAITITGRVHKASNTEITLAEFFNNPTIKGLIEYIEGKEGKSKFYDIEPAEKKEYYPLSSAQKRLYILQQMEPLSTGYNLTTAAVLEGKMGIDASWVEMIFQELTVRHESFRTSFKIENGEPVQVIQPALTFNAEYHDVTSLSSNSTHPTHLPQDVITKFVRPFELSKAPLLRVGLIKIEEGKHILVIDVHHIIHDGTSQSIVFKEINALTFGLGKNLPSLKLQYKDYAEWQLQCKDREEVRRQEEYWHEEFSREVVPLSMPFDYTRPALQSFEGNTVGFGLGVEATKHIIEFARGEGVTLFMVILSIYYVFLAKLSGQEDIVIGTPSAGRRHPDLQAIVGIFLNTLALRAYPYSDKTFREFLKEIKEKTLKAFDNQDYPFEDLVDMVVSERDLSRSPLFDEMFIFHNELSQVSTPGNKINDSSISTGQQFKISISGYAKQSSQYDFTLICFEGKDQLDFQVEYCTRLFNEETINCFINYFKNVINGIIENKDIRIADLEIITEDEKKRILFDFNNTEVEYPKEKTIHELFAEQAVRTPDYVAVFGHGHASTTRTNTDNNITYFQLDIQSDQLAGLLIEKGVLADNIIAIKIERSVEMIIGIMGILKSGAAYLPIDPEHPQERIDYMLKDSGAALLAVTNELEGEKVRRWEGELKGRPRRGLQHSAFSVLHSNLAYVIYTSGSTGKPKGVMIEHRSVINFITGITTVIPFSEDDRVLSLTTIAFDIFGLETIVPLTQGCKVMIGGRAEQLDAAAAGAAIGKEKITVLQVTPSRLHLLLSDINAAKSLQLLKYLLVGGEAFPISLLNAARNVTKGKIFNLYGPTETTIWSTVKDVTGENTLNIGRPIANTGIYILDKNNHIQPIGIAGDLYIAGDGLARGYLNRPELTFKKFDQDLWDKKDEQDKSGALRALNGCPRRGLQLSAFDLPRIQHSNLYCTGDLARWLPDGEIEFLGRIDTQVKIRGFRIELKEIETLLLRHKDIKEAVVTAWDDDERGKYLCAYIVCLNDIDIEELRDFLSGKVPVYMVPSHFIKLDRIPLNANQKVDHRALPRTGIHNAGAGDKFVAPRNEIEKQLAAIWTDLLKVEKVSVTGDFFKLGGNSMLLISLISRLKKDFSVELSMLQIFNASTLEKVGELIETQLAAGGEDKQPVQEKETIEHKIVIQEDIKEKSNENPGAIQNAGEFVEIVDDSILALIATGKLKPVDAAVLNYLPMDILQHTSLTSNDIVEGIFHKLPLLWQITDAPIGRLAHIMLPIFSFEIHHSPQGLINLAVEAIKIAAAVGARVIGLTGHMQTIEFANSLKREIKQIQRPPAITTAMDSIIGGMVLSYQGILEAAGRQAVNEKIALVGINDSSVNFLTLALETTPHPGEILLVDIEGRLQFKEKDIWLLKKRFSYRGNLRIAGAGSTEPGDIYNATFIIGALPNCIDVDKLRPGTLILNLSAPLLSFDSQKAISRIEKAQDILIQNSVIKMKSPGPARTLFYSFREWKEFYNIVGRVANQLNLPYATDPYAPLNTCQFSPLLTSYDKNCSPTSGKIDIKNVRKHYQALKKLGFTNAFSMLCGEKIIPSQFVQEFRDKYGISY